jgi:hypothetical protein
MTSRFRIAFVTAVAAWLVAGTGAAHACISVHIGAYPGSAHAGDPVRYSVSNLEPGAHYTISFNGAVIAQGVKGDGPVGGDVTMPDLGSESRPVLLSLSFDHSEIDGAQGIDTTFVTYEPTAPPAPPPPPPPTSPAPPPPAAPPTARVPHVVPHPVLRIHPAPRAPATHDTTSRRGASKPLQRTPTTAAAPAHALAPPASHAVTAVRGLIRQQTPSTAPAIEQRVHRTAPVHPPGRMTRATPAELRPLVAALPRSRRSHGVHMGWLLLGLVALFVLGLNAAAGFVYVRRSPRPRGGDEIARPEIEAELQELIAEERAKRELATRR